MPYIPILIGTALLLFRKKVFFPAKGKISSTWGHRFEGKDYHTGIDIRAPKGYNIYAVMDGKVYKTYPNPVISNYGNLIIIKHNDNLYSLYSHLDKILVKKGQSIIAGDIIGKLGDTFGNRKNPNKKVTTPHLHFEFLSRWPPKGKDLNRINPIPIFQKHGII